MMTTTTLPRLLVFTDVTSAARRGRGVIATVARMLDGVPQDAGRAVAVVVRDKTSSVDEVAARCAALRPITRRAGALLLVHTHAALVGPADLDGVHLDGAAGEPHVRAARLRLPPGAIVGVSRHASDVGPHGLDFAGADYATLSPIFSPTSKPDDTRPTLGVAALAGHARPVFALGGIDVDRVGPCLQAGAAGVAVLGGLFASTDPRRTLRAFLVALGTNLDAPSAMGHAAP
jgi:thiamine-phosphate pyrophosphorylase